MNIWNTIKQDVRALRSGRPGRRFRDFADARRQRRGAPLNAARVLTFVVGISLIIIGVGIGWLPGPGGFLAFVGLALIAQEISLVAKILDLIELTLRRGFSYLKRKLRNTT